MGMRPDHSSARCHYCQPDSAGASACACPPGHRVAAPPTQDLPCPAAAPLQIAYERVCDLRERRLDQEDLAAECAKAQEALRKEREQQARRAKLVEQSLAAIEQVGRRLQCTGPQRAAAAQARLTSPGCAPCIDC
jgi:hypothetical protein